MNINGNTSVYGIIGNPVSHSLSPVMHNRAFAAVEENGVYVPFPVEDVEAAIAGLRGLGVQGASVTIPHKVSVIRLLDLVDPVARQIGAVNTIHCVQTEAGVELHGSNTDWVGANRALEDHITLAGKSVVLLGAGGAARAIGFGLKQAGASVLVCSRTEQSGRALADDLGCHWTPIDRVDGLAADILVNATSVGMKPDIDTTLVSEKQLGTYQVVMDIVYAPLQTRLLREAENQGCVTVNGLEMLLYQGVAQFELWTGRDAPVEVMRRALLKATGNF